MYFFNKKHFCVDLGIQLLFSDLLKNSNFLFRVAAISGKCSVAWRALPRRRQGRFGTRLPWRRVARVQLGLVVPGVMLALLVNLHLILLELVQLLPDVRLKVETNFTHNITSMLCLLNKIKKKQLDG